MVDVVSGVPQSSVEGPLLILFCGKLFPPTFARENPDWLRGGFHLGAKCFLFLEEVWGCCVY